MSIALGGSTLGTWVTQANPNSGNVTLNKPTALANGHLLCVAVGARNSSTSLWGQTGFTLLARTPSTGTPNDAVNLLAKPITNLGGEPSSYSFTTPSSSRAAGLAFILTGVDLTAFADTYAEPSSYAAAGPTISLPAITPAVNDEAIISLLWTNQSTDVVPTLTAPTGFSDVYPGGLTTGASGASRSTLGVAVKALTGGAGTSTGTFTWGVSPNVSNSDGFTVGLKPYVAPPATHVLYVYNGSALVPGVAKVFNGTSWVSAG